MQVCVIGTISTLGFFFFIYIIFQEKLLIIIIIIIIKFVTIFTKTLINNIYNKLQDNTRDWNVEQDLRTN
jgi:hypothetical protein